MLKEKKISIVIFPGSNCDRDLFVALEKCLGTKPEFIWHNCSHIKSTDMILIPGGFSFGDYLRAGIIATKSPAIREVIRFSKKGVPIIGICNGFQILTECGLLEGALIKNSNQLFKCEKVNLKVVNNKTIFTKNYKLSEIISLPIAHSQGNYFIKPDKLKKIEDNGDFTENVFVKGRNEKVRFFNKGPSNNWQMTLPKEIQKDLETELNNELKELGYL